MTCIADPAATVAAVIVLACLAAAVVGVVVGAVLSAWATRRRLSAQPETFRCKLACAPATDDGADVRWPRAVSHASWAHDVLVVSAGRLHTAVRAIGVHFAEGPIEQRTRPGGFGKQPVILALQLDDGTRMWLASRRRDRLLAAGPFLAAIAMSERATTPRERS